MFAFRKLFFLLLCTVCVCEHGKIKKALNLASLQEAVKGDSDNAEELKRTCFPINSPSPDVIEIEYRISYGVSDEDNGNFTTIRYQWMASPVLSIVEAHLLQILSLCTFRNNSGQIYLSIVLTSDQWNEIDLGNNDDVCPDDDDDPPPLLKELTSDLCSLVEDSSGRIQEKGHVALINMMSNRSCVNDKAKLNDIILLVLCYISAIFLSICFPTIIAHVREQLDKKMKREDSDMKFYIWATAFIFSSVASILTGADIIVCIMIFIKTSWSTEGILFSAFLITAIASSLITNFILLACVYGNTTAAPHAPTEKTGLLEESTVEDETSSRKGDSKTESQANNGTEKESDESNQHKIMVAKFFACFLSTLFLILFTFHFIFIMLGAFVSPVVALAHLAFYITSLVSFIASFALIIKFISKSKCKGSCCKIDGTSCIVNAPPVITAILFVIVVIFTGLLYFFLIEMVQNSQRSHDLFSVLSTFLPSAILGVAGFLARKLMNCATPNKTT